MKIVRAILFILNVIFAIGLVLTSLAVVIAPSKSIFPSLFAFGYLPMLALNAMMIVLWLVFGRWEFLLSTVAILSRYTLVPLFIQVGGNSTVPPADEHPLMVTLMTYNLHNFQGHDKTATPTDSNVCEFLTLVREHQPDILCLQEYLPGRKVSATDSLVLMGYNHYYSTAGSPSHNPRSVVVFSKLPFTYVKGIDRTKLMVEVLKDNRRFRVCCVHMDSYQFDDTDFEEIEKMRHGEVQESSRRTFSKVKQTLIQHEEEWNNSLQPLIAECSVPMVLAGDMNDIPSSFLYHKITRHLKDTYTEKGIGFSTTYDGAFPKFRIDMVFHSEGISTLSYKRLRSKISDHYPVLVAFELNDETTAR